MTEVEWLAATNPAPMLEYLRGRVSDRRLRLLLCGIGRLMPDGYYRDEEAAALEISEAYADDAVSLDALNKVRKNQKRWQSFGSLTPVSISWSSLLVCSRNLLMQSCFELCARTLRCRIVEITDQPAWERNRELRHSLFERERPVFVALLRDIFGNPFRPITLNPSWLTSTVVTLANGIYNEKAFDRLLILADALQDAGCDNEDILNHCRKQTEHVRGCWCVDLLTGRS